MRLRLRFAKRGPLRFVAHLDLAETIHRLMRRSAVPLVYSQGFNPQPAIALSPPLALGFEGEGELADVRLTRRVSPTTLLRGLRGLSVAGLEWTGAEEVSLKAPSVQQAIEHYTYRLSWKAPDQESAASLFPGGIEGLQQAVDRFMASKSRPVEVQRKGKVHTRDARAFLIDCRFVAPAAQFTGSLEMVIRSDDGTTLNPLVILGAIVGSPKDVPPGVRVVRLPLNL